MATKVLVEAIYIRKGKIMKRIQFLEDTLGFSIIEQELIENRYKPIGNPDVWKTNFFLPTSQRDIARSTFIGRTANASYEEGNRE